MSDISEKPKAHATSEDSYVEKRNEARPSSGEAPFHPGEVFYSRTNERGIIQSGNYVFKRVAHYDWEDLIGAPHKVIRHPDMPKGLFHIFWERLLRGDLVGAYVKNRSKDGLHYWVYAVATPWRGGFLSARIKPTSKRLAQVEKLYRDAVAREAKGNLTSQESADALMEDLKQHGFETYEDFARDSLAEELLSESDTLGVAHDERIVAAREMLELAETLGQSTAKLSKEFNILSNLPQNMQIKVSRLEPVGGPLTALSQNYQLMSHQISNWFNENVAGENNNFATITDSVKEALFLSGASGILNRCQMELQKEQRSLGGSDLDEEREQIQQMAADYGTQAKRASTAVNTEVSRILKACEEMHRTLLGLNTVRVTCNIENSRLGASSNSLEKIIEQFGSSQANIEEHLGEVECRCKSMAKLAERSANISTPVDVESSYSRPQAAKVA